MARSDDQVSRANRVPIMLSDAELAFVDEWRFANKVASRSEAVRRLVKAALAKAEGRTDA